MRLKLIRKNSLFGIKIISIIYYLATIFSLVIALIAFFKPEIIKGAPTLGGQVPPEYFIISLGVFSIFLVFFSFFIAIGLQNKSNGARASLIVFSVINALGGIISIIEGSYLSSINLVFNLGIIYYLAFNKKVKSQFSNQRKISSELKKAPYSTY